MALVTAILLSILLSRYWVVHYVLPSLDPPAYGEI